MTSLSKVKQPAPSVAGITETTDAEGKKYKVTQGPHVGVIEVPKMSKTPLTDWIELKKEENPYTVYKIHNKEYKISGIHTTVGIGVVVCGIISLFKLFKK
ncbi:hypothetical protein IJ531_04750 [bacterium]|nr:hypothetical protein [bacterium]